LSGEFRCPVCNADFNPECRNHHDYYFEPKESAGDKTSAT
jgi:uncharacterized CHY-type Zn-finger protein